MKSKLLMFIATLVASASIPVMQAQTSIPYLPMKADFGGTSVTTPEDFLPSSSDYTLEVEGTSGTEISIAGGIYTYTPSTNGKVRFAQKGGKVYVYEGNTYKTELTPVDKGTYPDIFAGTDDATAKTGIYDERNLFANPGFETSLDGSTTPDFEAADWTDDNVGGNSRVRASSLFPAGEPEGVGVFMAHSGACLSQTMSGLKSNTPYKLKIRTWSHANSGQSAGNWYIGFGSAAKAYEIFQGTFSKASTTTYVKADVEYTFRTGDLSSYSSVIFSVYPYERTGNNMPITNYDRMTLVEGVVPAGITGASNPTYLDGSAYAPEVSLEGKDYFDFTSYLKNPSFESGSGTSVTNWTNENNVFQLQNNASFNLKVGTNYCERWQKEGALSDCNIHQTLSDLPNGYYKLTAAAGFNGTGAFLYANSDQLEFGDNNDYYIVTNVTTEAMALGIKLVGATSNYVRFDNFRLYYYGETNPLISIKQDDLAALLTEAGTLTGDMQSSVATALSTAIATGTANSSSNDLATLENSISLLTTTIADAKTSISAYATFKAAYEAAEILAAEFVNIIGYPAFVEAIEAAKEKYDEASLSTEEISAEIATLKAAGYTCLATAPNYTDYIVNPSADSRTIDGWAATGNSGIRIMDNEHYGNDGVNGYTNPYFDTNAWGNTIVATISQEISNLPAGKYLVKVAARGASGTAMSVFANNTSTTIPCINADINSGELGRGWSWSTAIATIAEDEALTIGIKINNTSSSKWHSYDEFSLHRLDVPYAIEVNNGAITARGAIDVLDLANNYFNEETTSVHFAPGASVSDIIAPPNPNIIYYGLPAGALFAMGIDADNLPTVNLDKWWPFNAPIGFDVDNVTYTREFNENDAISNETTISGWQSIVLPFDVNTIIATQGTTEIELKPFAEWSKDEEGSKIAEYRPFWLYQVNPDATSNADAFIAADAIKANTMYLISMPNDPAAYGAAYNITGEVKFIGFEIKATSLSAQETKAGYSLNPNFAGMKENVYGLNEDGSAWVADQTVLNFHGYASTGDGSTPQSLPIFGGNDVTSIKEVLSGITSDSNAVLITTDNGVIMDSAKAGKVAVYTADGQLVKVVTISEGNNFIALPAGQYVINGSVAIVK